MKYGMFQKIGNKDVTNIPEMWIKDTQPGIKVKDLFKEINK